MRSPGSPYSKILAGVIAGAIIALLVAGVIVKVVRRQSPPPGPALLLRQGFDFKALRSENLIWRGPALGEKIDLTRLKAADASELGQLLGKQPVMLASINPTCAMCSVAKDEMQFVREHVVPAGVQYYAVCFRPVDSISNFYEYANSIGIAAPTFEWQGEVAPPLSILDMTVPSHLLIAQDGTVLQVWPGSSNEKEVRDRMGSQIVEDTLIISEVLRLGAFNLPSNSKPPAKPQ